MMGLDQSLEGLKGNDMGRVPRALHESVFPSICSTSKALEFLELRQGTMIVLEYVAKFTELAHFAGDYVAMNMAKVRKFEDGLKLSRPESRSDPIGGSEPSSGCETQDWDSLLDIYIYIYIFLKPN